MIIRTKTLPEEGKQENTLLKNIPEKAKRDIEERGFYLYEWISSEEVKMSIQRDYLEFLSKFWVWIGAFAIFWALLWGWLNPLGFSIFFWILAIAYSITLLYLSFIALKRSISLSNTAKVVLTDKALSLWGEIIRYDEIEKHEQKINAWGKEFSEPLFGESALSKEHSSLLSQTMEKIWNGAKKIFEFSGNFRWNSKDAGQIVLLLFILWGFIFSEFWWIVV